MPQKSLGNAKKKEKLNSKAQKQKVKNKLASGKARKAPKRDLASRQTHRKRSIVGAMMTEIENDVSTRFLRSHGKLNLIKPIADADKNRQRQQNQSNKKKKKNTKKH